MITKKQKQVLNFIANYQGRKEYAPSLDEIRKRFRLASVSTAHFYISKLRDLGYLTKEENKSRSIDVVGRESMVKIPLLGNIAAGEPIEVIEIPDETITVPRSDIRLPFQHYALRVKGDSMVKEGIFNNDIIVIRSQKTADNGQTVVAIIDDNQVTLKKIFKEKDKIRLQPANKNIRPFFRKKVEIRGVVEKIIRTP
jgi:repressor LexA